MSNSTDRKAAAAIYREAARRLELRQDDRACIAIEHAQGLHFFGCKPHSEAHRHYVECMLEGCIVSATLYHDLPTPSDAHEARVVALCFMAAMVEAGDA